MEVSRITSGPIVMGLAPPLTTEVPTGHRTLAPTPVPASKVTVGPSMYCRATRPAGPVAPAVPAGPSAPAEPAGPWAPREPAGPGAPAGPAGPCTDPLKSFDVRDLS